MACMKALNWTAYSYRQDGNVIPFPDDNPVLILDGHCVLCTGGAAKLMEWDRAAKFRYMPAQSETGLSILKHYGIDWDDTYLLLHEGRAYTKSDGYLKVAEILGGAWKFALIFSILPRFLRDFAYDFLARHRYKWFGTVEYCTLLPEKYKDRILQDQF